MKDLKRLKELEHEDAKLKRMYAELALENAAIHDLRSARSPWNRQRRYRVYCALRLSLPRRRERRVPRRAHYPLQAPTARNHPWAVDFMTDTLYDGRRFHTLNVRDEGNREGLAIGVEMSLPSVRAIAVLDDLVELYGPPHALTPTSCTTSSPANPSRTRTSNASTGAIVPTSSTPSSSTLSRKCAS